MRNHLSYLFVIQDAKFNVLRLIWNKNCDSLKIDPVSFVFDENTMIKKKNFSLVGRIFEHIGLIAAVLIQPELLFSEFWKTKESQDTEVSDDKKKRLGSKKEWQRNLSLLWDVKVPSRSILFSSCTTYKTSIG